MKPKESAGCHQTLSMWVGSGDETKWSHNSLPGGINAAMAYLVVVE